MRRRFTPRPVPRQWAREWLAEWARARLPALRAAPVPPCRHPGVTLLIYAFPADGDFTLFEHAIRQSWAVLGALPTVVVTHDAALVPPMAGVETQVEPTLRPGDVDSMSRDCLTRLHTRFATPRVLVVQDDGFPLRDELDAFLRYDYVGAPNVRPGWRGRVADALGLTVLNGGFSLRSRRVCRWAARAWRLRRPWARRTPPEDRVYSPLRLLPWLRFPPAAAAARFSQDTLEGHLPFFDDLPPMGAHRAQTLRAALSPLPRLTVVSAVRDAACHRRCVRENPHLRGARFVAFDNAARNVPIPERYNAFVETMPADTEWILFAHEDFEVLEDPRPLLRTRPTWFPLGLIGTRFVGEALILPFGRVQDCARDGSGLRTVGAWRWVGRLLGDMVENFDCCGFFVHADLFRRLGLRFDPRCAWDLYAEDFCFQFILRTGHLARLLPLRARHWSRGDARCARFLATRDYLSRKYRDHGFAGGTCTLCVGQRFPFGFLTALRALCLARRLLGRA